MKGLIDGPLPSTLSSSLGSSHYANVIVPGFHTARPCTLLVITKEDLDGKPVITTDLEAVGDGINLGHLVVRQLKVQVKVGLDARLGHALGQHAAALLDAPDEQNLLGRTALVLSNGQDRLVLVQRRVVAAQGRVRRAVNALGGVVRQQLGRRVARVDLDLVNGWDDLSPLLVLPLSCMCVCVCVCV